jgi:Na+-exporting ATPase
LAFAQKLLTGADHQERQVVEGNMIFLGLIGIFDGLRPESSNLVRQCHRAGIIVHMLTGDHVATATAVAKEAGIISPSTQGLNSILTGEELERLSDREIDMLPSLPLILARCSPKAKVRMIEGLRRRGRVTAMIGDGVNDCLAVKKADVGIAMGVKGSDVTREAAEIVLEDDNFSTIVAAITEGRRIFDNQLKFILYLMSSNCAEVIVLVIGLAFRDEAGRFVYPLSPVQILWENLITCAFPAFGY